MHTWRGQPESDILKKNMYIYIYIYTYIDVHVYTCLLFIMHIYLSITSFAGLQPLTLNASSEVSKWKRCYMASDMWSLGATFFEVVFWEPQGISGGWWARDDPHFGGWHIYWVLGGWTENIHREPPCLDDEKSTIQQFKAEFGRRRMVLGALVGEEHIQLPFGWLGNGTCSFNSTFQCEKSFYK